MSVALGIEKTSLKVLSVKTEGVIHFLQLHADK